MHALEQFQSSRPVAGARIQQRLRDAWSQPGFNPRAPLPGRASKASLNRANALRWFQSSRPVAGARISSQLSRDFHDTCFNPRAPLPGRASARPPYPWPCRDGFNPRAPLPGRASWARFLAKAADSSFNPRAPLPGRASRHPGVAARCNGRFNPRAPLPGRASYKFGHRFVDEYVSILAPRCRGAHPAGLNAAVLVIMFQSSRPVAGARIVARCYIEAAPGFVSILAPRCRGAHLKRLKARTATKPSFNPRAPLPGRASC